MDQSTRQSLISCNLFRSCPTVLVDTAAYRELASCTSYVSSYLVVTRSPHISFCAGIVNNRIAYVPVQMEHTQSDRRPLVKGIKIAIKVPLGLFIIFLVLNALWFAWRPWLEHYADELLYGLGFGTVNEHSQLEEEIQIASARWKAYYERQYANIFDMPKWKFLDEDGNDTGYIHGPYQRAVIYSDYTEVACWPSTQVAL